MTISIQRQEVFTMHKAFNVILGGGLVVAASAVALTAQEQPVERAFEHYERMRSALAQDTTKGVTAEAKALSPLATDIAGERAGHAATSLAQAKNVEEAREQFGLLRSARAEVPGRRPSRCAGVCLFDETETMGSARQHGGQPVLRQGDGHLWDTHKRPEEAVAH